MEVRLQKYLADAGVASRRKAEELIAQGKVKVNGEVVTEMGCKIDPKKDDIFGEVKILNSPTESMETVLAEGYTALFSEGEMENLRIEAKLPQEIKAPVEKGQELGKAVLFLGRKNWQKSTCWRRRRLSRLPYQNGCTDWRKTGCAGESFDFPTMLMYTICNN